MKVGIMTGLKELDLEIQNKVKQSSLAYYPEYFFQDTEITIAIVSPIGVKNTKIDFKDFLYELRKRNMRVIVLLDNEYSEYLQATLSLGITDIIFDPISVDKVIYKLKYNTPFSDIAKYYVKNQGYIAKNTSNKNINNIEKLLKVQIINLFKYFDKKVDNDLSINEMMVLLENEIIKKNL